MNRTNLSSHLPILGSSSFCLASFQNLPRWLTVSIHLSAPRRDCQSLGPCGRGGHETATVLPLCATTLKIDLCLLSQVRWVPLMGQLIHIECSVCLYKGYYITNPKNSFSEANHWTLPYICILWSLQYGQLNDPCHTLSLSLCPHVCGFNMNELAAFTCGLNPIFVATVTLEPSIVPVLIHLIPFLAY